MFRFFAAALLILSTGCKKDHCPEGDPEIVDFTAESTTVAAGDAIALTLDVANFELEVEGHDEGGHEEGHHDDDDGHHDDEEECAGGHVHVYLDSLDRTNPLVMTVDTAFNLVVPPETSTGPHALIARLQNRDHTIIEPQVTAELEFTVTSR